MGLLEETLRGKSLADYTNTQLRLALGAVLYTNTADMWKRYLNQLGYSGDVSQMLQKYYVDYSVPSNFRNYINAGASIFNPQHLFLSGEQGYVYDINDLSTLFLDSALTTPATVNGLVGGVVDKSGRGNHATQATTGNKPVLRGTPVGGNLVTNGDFASGTGWTAGAGWAIGSGVATATTSSSTLTSTLTATASKNYRVTYTITLSAGSVVMSFGGLSGASRSAAGTYVDYLDSTTNTNALVFTGTGFSGTVDNIEVVDVTAGSVKAPYALQFDGSDDFLQTASVNFSATDKMLICHGVRTLSNAVTGMIAELSSIFSTTAGSWALYYIPNAQYYWGVGGTPAGTLGGVNTTALPAPTTRVITGVGNISAPEATLRINGLQSATSASSFGTGNFGNHILYFGRRAGNEYPFNGLFYSAICVGKTASAAELANIERWVNLRTGAY